MNLIPLETAVRQFDEARAKINEIAQQCKNIIVSNDDSLATAENLAKTAREVDKLIETKRKEVTKPLLDRKKEIDNFAKEITAELNDAVKGLRSQILTYKQEQERKRQEELRRIEEEKRKKEEELKAKLAAEEEIKPEEVQEFKEIRAEEQKLQSAPAPSGIRKQWTFELVDLNKVPHQYLMLDEAKVKAAIKLGVRDIPGIRIFQKESLVLR